MATSETNDCKQPEDSGICEEDEELTVSPPDGGWGWVIVGAAFVTSVIVDGIIFSFGILLPELLKEFTDAGKSSISWIGSGLAGTYLLVGPVVSALANRFDCRRVAIVGSLVSSAAFLASIFATSVVYLIICYGIIGGIGFGLIYLPSIVMVQFYFEKRRAFATGIAVCGSGIGTFIFSPLTQVLIDTFGWRGMLLIQGGIILNCAAVSGLFRPLQPKKKKSKKRKSKSKQVVSAEVGDSLCATNGGLKQILSGLCHRPKPLLHRIKDARQMQWQSQTSFESIPLNEDNEFISDKNNECSAADANHGRLPNGSLCTSELTDNNNSDGTTMQHDDSQQVPIDQHDSNGAVLGEVRVNGVIPSNEPVSRTDLSRMVNGSVVSRQSDATQEPNGVVKVSCRMHDDERTIPVRSKSFSGLRSRGSKDKCRSPLPKPRAGDLARPFYRKDIFFSGSIERIPDLYTVSPIKKLNSDIIEEEVDDAPRGCCDGNTAQIFKEMVDISLLKSPTFILMCLAGFLTFMGFFVPFVYLSDFARSVGVEKDQAAFLLSIIGIANTVGRVFCGWVTDLPQVKAIYINNGSLLIAGGTTIALPFMTIYGVQVAYSLIFGLAIACFVSLRSIVLVELLGLEKLTNSFGLTLLFQGSASLVGAPLAGWLYDQTGTYDSSFYMAGVLIAISGIISCPLPRIAKWEHDRAEKKLRSKADEESCLQSTVPV